MKRLIGPMLHLRQGTEKEWRFSVGMWVEDPQPAGLKLGFSPNAKAKIDAQPVSAGRFGGGEWLRWSVNVPRRKDEFRTSYRIDGLPPEPIVVDDVVIPGVGQPPRIAFFSCNGVQDKRLWTQQPEMEALWGVMEKRHLEKVKPDGSGGPYHVLLGGGDQIYCDSVWQDVPELEALGSWKDREKAEPAATLAQSLEALYATLYKRWSQSWFHKLHSRVPGLYTWDDHDIFDGYGSYSDDLQRSKVFQAIFAQAKRAFVLFQLGGGPSLPDTPCRDAKGQHFLQAVRFDDQLDVVLLDLRSDRSDARVMKEPQWADLKTYLKTRLVGAPKHLLVVSSIPLVYLNFGAAEKSLDWLPWRQDLEDDLRDQWESAAHQEERGRLIMTLLDHSRASGSRVSILSGDVHVGARAKITSRRPDHLQPPETEVSMHQLTSSAIVYPAPGALTLAGMRAVAKEGPTPLATVSQVETEMLAVGAQHFLLGKTNFLSVEPDPNWASSEKRLWTRWVTKNEDVKPPIVVHRRQEGVKAVGKRGGARR